MTRPGRITHSWPPQVFTPEVKLPGGWVRCPLCTRHYVIKGKANPRLCFLVTDA